MTSPRFVDPTTEEESSGLAILSGRFAEEALGAPIFFGRPGARHLVRSSIFKSGLFAAAGLCAGFLADAETPFEDFVWHRHNHRGSECDRHRLQVFARPFR